MKIAGWCRLSLIDDPGHLAAVLFVPGCNLDCFYCHNRWLIRDSAETIPLGKILGFLEERMDVLDSVVISGGEPTLQVGLAIFLRNVKSMGYRVKMDTNGSRPDVIDEILKEGLVDFVAMDLKAPESRFKEICGVSVPSGTIEASMHHLLASGVDHEFRITVIPQFGLKDLVSMARLVHPEQCLVLQPYRRPQGANTSEDRLWAQPHGHGFLLEAARTIRSFLPHCRVRRN